MAKKTATTNDAVTPEPVEVEIVTHAAEFIEKKKPEINIGDKFIHLLGVNRQVHQVVDIFGGPGTPGGSLYFLTPAILRPRIGDQLFITVTEKMLTMLFRPFKPGRPSTGTVDPDPKTDEGAE